MASALYVYAIVARGTPLPAAGPGGGADGLALVPWRELAAVSGTVGAARTPVTMEAVLHHEAVVEAARRQGPALPVRFGTVFRDAQAIARALAERYEPLAADLRRLGDKVELSLTALWPAAPSGTEPALPTGEGEAPAGEGAGAQYLRARAAELRRDEALNESARTLARELDEMLGGLALERRVALLPTPRVALRTAYLLEPAAVAAFRTAFEAVRHARGELRLLLTGPWPPYSFVGRTETESGATRDGTRAELAQLLSDAIRRRPG